MTHIHLFRENEEEQVGYEFTEEKRFWYYTWAATWRPVATCRVCIQNTKGDTRQICTDRKRSPGDSVCLWLLPSVQIWKTHTMRNGQQTTCSHILKSAEWLPSMATKDSTQGAKIRSACQIHFRKVYACSRCIMACSNVRWYTEHWSYWVWHWSSGSSRDQICGIYWQKMNEIK